MDQLFDAIDAGRYNDAAARIDALAKGTGGRGSVYLLLLQAYCQLCIHSPLGPETFRAAALQTQAALDLEANSNLVDMCLQYFPLDEALGPAFAEDGGGPQGAPAVATARFLLASRRTAELEDVLVAADRRSAAAAGAGQARHREALALGIARVVAKLLAGGPTRALHLAFKAVCTLHLGPLLRLADAADAAGTGLKLRPEDAGLTLPRLHRQHIVSVAGEALLLDLLLSGALAGRGEAAGSFFAENRALFSETLRARLRVSHPRLLLVLEGVLTPEVVGAAGTHLFCDRVSAVALSALDLFRATVASPDADACFALLAMAHALGCSAGTADLNGRIDASTAELLTSAVHTGFSCKALDLALACLRIFGASSRSYSSALDTVVCPLLVDERLDAAKLSCLDDLAKVLGGSPNSADARSAWNAATARVAVSRPLRVFCAYVSACLSFGDQAPLSSAHCEELSAEFRALQEALAEMLSASDTPADPCALQLLLFRLRYAVFLLVTAVHSASPKAPPADLGFLIDVMPAVSSLYTRLLPVFADPAKTPAPPAEALRRSHPHAFFLVSMLERLVLSFAGATPESLGRRCRAYQASSPLSDVSLHSVFALDLSHTLYATYAPLLWAGFFSQGILTLRPELLAAPSTGTETAGASAKPKAGVIARLRGRGEAKDRGNSLATEDALALFYPQKNLFYPSPRATPDIQSYGLPILVQGCNLFSQDARMRANDSAAQAMLEAVNPFHVLEVYHHRQDLVFSGFQLFADALGSAYRWLATCYHACVAHKNTESFKFTRDGLSGCISGYCGMLYGPSGCLLPLGSADSSDSDLLTPLVNELDMSFLPAWCRSGASAGDAALLSRREAALAPKKVACHCKGFAGLHEILQPFVAHCAGNNGLATLLPTIGSFLFGDEFCRRRFLVPSDSLSVHIVHYVVRLAYLSINGFAQDQVRTGLRILLGRLSDSRSALGLGKAVLSPPSALLNAPLIEICVGLVSPFPEDPPNDCSSLSITLEDVCVSLPLCFLLLSTCYFLTKKKPEGLSLIVNTILHAINDLGSALSADNASTPLAALPVPLGDKVLLGQRASLAYVGRLYQFLWELVTKASSS